MVKQNDGYDIRQLISLLLSKIWLIIVCAILFGTCSFLYTKFLVPLKYESYTSLYVRSDRVTATSTTQEENTNSVNLSNLTFSKSLVDTYVVVLKSNSVMDKIGNLLVLEFDEETLSSVFRIQDGRIDTNSIKSCFTMTSIEETEAMKISAVTTDPEISAALCNMMAQVAPDFLIRVVGAGSVEVIDPAVPNYTPVSASAVKNALLGALVGIVVAAGLIFVVDFFDDTVKTSDELSEMFDKAVLGDVQKVVTDDDNKKKKKKKGESSRQPRMLLVDKVVPFNVVESYKSIRTNIMFALGTSDKKIIAISSPNPSEGKSTASANIALAFAQTNSRVLLIDADMRKSVQHKTFKLSNTKGLSTLIVNMSTPEESIKSDVMENLDVLTSGPMPPNPSELLSSDQYAALIRKLAKQYDYIIIDTPPINVVSDALVMTNSVSGVVLVVKHKMSTYDDIAESLKQLEFAGANMLGFVLNDVQGSRRGYYYNYKYKYKYSYRYRDYAYRDYAYRSDPKEEEKDDAAADDKTVDETKDTAKK